MLQSTNSRPMLVYDGECPFCVAWVRHWRSLTGGAVEFAPFQSAAGSYPRIPLERFRESVQLVMPDGTVHSGARAVCAILSQAGRRRWLWAYERVPGFAPAAEALYRMIARRRSFLGRICRLAAGAPSNRAGNSRPACCS
jgi:predicted DCC family thiol-disulfide oxidoreductase YuxK